VSKVMETLYTPRTTQETRGFSSFLENPPKTFTEPSLVLGLGRVFGDLRFSEQRPGILHRCGLNCTMSYSEMVAAKGGISPYEFLRTTTEVYSGRKT